MVIPIPERLA